MVAGVRTPLLSRCRSRWESVGHSQSFLVAVVGAAQNEADSFFIFAVSIAMGLAAVGGDLSGGHRWVFGDRMRVILTVGLERDNVEGVLEPAELVTVDVHDRI